MSSILLFHRFHFDPRIEAKNQDENISKLKTEKETLLKLISFDTDINKFIRESIHTSLLRKDTSWNFGGITEGEDYIYGRLGKVKGKITNVIDPEIKDFIPNVQKEGDVCNFLFDMKNHILTYESKRNVGPKAPYLIIKTIFNSYYSEKVRIEFELLKNRKEILQKINELDGITSIKLNLRSTNPDGTTSSKKMDEYIRSFRATKMNIEIIAPKNGSIDINASSGIVQSGIRLAEEGHGSARIEGFKEIEVQEEKGKSTRKAEIIDSVGLPIQKNITLSNKDYENIKKLMNTTSDLIKMYNEIDQPKANI